MVVGKKELFKLLAIGTLTVALLLGGIVTTRHMQVAEPVSQVIGDFIPANEPGLEAAGTAARGGFFHEYRLDRDRLRSKQVEMLQDVVKSSQADTKSRDAAGMRLVEIAEAMEKELKAENLLKAEGYQECVIMVQTDSTTIVLQSPPMPAQQSKRVTDLVGKAINTSPEKLSLVTRGLP